MTTPPTASHATPGGPSPAYPRTGSGLYHALRLTPIERRAALHLWLNWWHEISRIPFDVHDPGVAETKLRWWQQELARTEQGQPQHPLMRDRLTLAHNGGSLAWPDAALWQQQLDGMVQLVHQTRWMDDSAFVQHARLSTGAACEGAACLLGTQSDQARAAARQLGLGLRLAHRLVRLGQDARAGWVLVGIDLLQAHDVRAHQLTKPDLAQPPTGLLPLLDALQQSADAALADGLAQVRTLPAREARALRPLVYLALLARRTMREAVSQGPLILSQRVTLTPLRKSWMAQQVAWGWLR